MKAWWDIEDLMRAWKWAYRHLGDERVVIEESGRR